MSFEAKNTTLLRELADREDGRLMSRNHYLTWVWMSGSLMDHNGGKWGNKVKRPLILQMSPRMASLNPGGVFISSFLPSTGGQNPKQRHFGFAVRQRGKILWGRPLCMIINNKSNGKQVKETVLTRSQDWLLPATGSFMLPWELGLCRLHLKERIIRSLTTQSIKGNFIFFFCWFFS